MQANGYCKEKTLVLFEIDKTKEKVRNIINFQSCAVSRTDKLESGPYCPAVQKRRAHTGAVNESNMQRLLHPCVYAI